MSRPPQKIDPARAAALYLSGLSLSQVGEVLGFSRSAIHRRLQQDGVQLREHVRRIPVDDGVLVRLHEQGLKGPAIAERTGMNVQTVYERLRKQGLGRSPRRRRPKREVAAPILQDLEAKALAARVADEVLRAACKAAVEAGLSGTSIGRAVGVSANTVRAWIVT